MPLRHRHFEEGPDAGVEQGVREALRDQAPLDQLFDDDQHGGAVGRHLTQTVVGTEEKNTTKQTHTSVSKAGKVFLQRNKKESGTFGVG